MKLINNKTIIFRKIWVVFGSILIATLPFFSKSVLALDFGSGPEKDLSIASQDADAPTIAVNIINLALALLGLVLVALIIYGGLMWMLARGNEEELTKARGILKAALIGLLITLSAYGIATYVFKKLLEATS